MIDQAWKIHYLIVDTEDWLPGRKMAIEPQTIASIDWANKEILTNLTSNAVEKKSDSAIEVERLWKRRLENND
jgi:hypothetical protein